MANRSDILIELQSISPTLAEIAPVNPYHVPKEFFENFASEVIILVTKEKPSAILGGIAQTPYKAPSNYFENLPEKLLAFARSDEGASLVLPRSAVNPYLVPQGYFEELAGNILKRVRSDDGLSVQEELEFLSPVLSKLDKKTPFSTPDGYFDDFTSNVLGGRNSVDFEKEEFENLSPLMSSLKSASGYQVPNGYFENLPELALKRAKGDAPARVVSITFRKKLMRYATAAVVAGIIIVGGYLFMNRQDVTVAPGTIAQTEEIQRETQTKVEGLSDDELAGFLENQMAPMSDILGAAAIAEIDSDDVMMMLADIPDSELKQYLVEYGDDREVLTN